MSGVVQEVKVGKGEDILRGMLLVVQGTSKVSKIQQVSVHADQYQPSQTETQVSSPVAGKIKYVAKTGESLEKGDLLAEIEC